MLPSQIHLLPIAVLQLSGRLSRHHEKLGIMGKCCEGGHLYSLPVLGPKISQGDHKSRGRGKMGQGKS